MKITEEFKELFVTFKKLNCKRSPFLFAIVLALLAAILEGGCIALLTTIFRATIGSEYGLLSHNVIGRGLTRYFDINGKPEYLLLIYIGLFCFGCTLKNAIQYLSVVVLSKFERFFTHRLRVVIFNTCLDYGKLFFDKNSTGTIHQISVTLPQLVANYLTHLNVLITQGCMLGMYCIAMFYISWRLTVISLILFPLLTFGLRWLIEKIKMSTNIYAESQKELGRKISNVFSAISLVKSYSYEPVEKRNLESVSDVSRTCEYSIDKKIFLIPHLQDVIAICSIFAVFGGIAFILIQRNQMHSIPKLMVYFYAFKRASASFNFINEAKASLVIVNESIKTIFDTIKSDRKYIITDGTIPLNTLAYDIEFKDVHYRYSDDRKVFAGINLKFKHGKMTAVVGPSGAGKSSLIHLIIRFYDIDSGQILIGGRDIRELTLESLRKNIALVSQDVQLFNDTLKSNVVYGLKNVSEEEVWNCLAQAELADFADRLPEHLNTLIGERGLQLSGGERQRLSIARAFLKKANILILDEATSSLDSETEHLIQKAITKLISGKTAIVVAHRLSTIRHADEIIVIENGQVREEGDFQALIAKQGRFYHYWQEQSSRL